MKRQFFKQEKAKGIVAMWGRFRYLWNSNTFYIQIIQFSSILLLVFNDTLRDWFYNNFGISLHFWMFISVVVVCLLLGMVFEHKVTIPGSQRYAGEQFIKHSPFGKMQKDIELLIEDNKKIKTKLGIKDE